MDAVITSLRRIRLDLIIGAAGFVAIAAIGALVASVRSVPFLPLMVTLDEWVGALVFVPWLLVRLFRGPVVSEQKDSAIALWYFDRAGLGALVVFLLDLVTRACFSLGWKPF